MVAVPDLMAAALEQGAIDLETVKAVQLGGDRPLRADGRPHGDPRPATGALPAGVRRVATADAGYDSKFAALY